MIFVASDKSLGRGGAVVSGGLGVTVLEQATGTFPLSFVLFLLFSLGELGITRGVICGSPGLVSSSSLASLAADEVQESVKFSSREKLAVCKVIEGAVKLSPGRGQRVAPLEVVG
jgi:hypothetical protein